MRTILIFTVITLLSVVSLHAQTGKPIRGTVVDDASGMPLPYVTIVVLNSGQPTGATSDGDGNFSINNLPVGRYDIQASFLGYEPAIFRELAVSSSKELFLTISLKESVLSLDEVVVRPKINKEEPLNQMATTSARMLSIEESSRYAGGFDDPARLVTAFAGVAGGVSSNAIAIRGNSPQFLQWKLDGVEIPNPTHFPDITGVGGGILSALSSNVLGNSDFFTGAFPAEYNNALSGVFDMQLRNGNRWDYEHAVQIGTLGIEVGSEGPFKKDGKASYIFNYRYSTMALAGDLFPDLIGDAGDMRYQDLSFKLNFPTAKAGTFSVWGVGVIDHLKEEPIEDISKWETVADNISGNHRQDMGVGGIGHKVFINDNAYIKSALAGNFTKNHLRVDLYDEQMSPTRTSDMKGTNINVSLNSYINTKFSARHTNRTGFNMTNLYYDLDYNISPTYPNDFEPMENFAKSDGNTFLLSAFSNSTIRLGNAWIANIGVTGQYFLLNDHWTIEPRVGLKWNVNTKHSFGLAYGMHSRHEKLDYYFVTTPETDSELVNKDLDFTKAHHIVLSYDWAITDNTHLKVEPYYQYLYDVPVEKGSSFSIINHRAWYLTRILVNEGEGRNYGVDITLERYLSDGYYYMFTASIFDSRYKGGDGVWHNTRLNRNFVLNALGGKEWALGRNNQNILGVNLRLSYQGGDRYSPIDEAASEQAQDAVFDTSRAYDKQLDPALTASFTVSYKINRKKVAHIFALKMINVTGYEEYDDHYYNFVKNNVEMRRSSVAIPNVCYKIEF